MPADMAALFRKIGTAYVLSGLVLLWGAAALDRQLQEGQALVDGHDHKPLKWEDEGISGCPTCERQWEPPAPAPAEA